MHSARVFRHKDPHKLNYFWGYETKEERKAALKKSQRAYDQSPKGKAAHVLKRHRRRAKGSDVVLTVDETLQVFQKFSHKCFNCEAKKDLTLDHHIPLNLGGILRVSNCVILCRTCNGVKADTHPKDFYKAEQLVFLRSHGVTDDVG